MLAAIGANIVAKRAAAIHVLFNVSGAIIFLIFLGLFTHFNLNIYVIRNLVLVNKLV